MSKPGNKNAVGNKGGGRPTEYRPEFAEEAFRAALLGLGDEQLADYFGVSRAGLNKWKRQFPEFRQRLLDGKVKADANVAHAMYQKAIGYEHPDEHIAVSNGEVIVTPTTKRYPPDSHAATRWLVNRQHAYWRDKQPDENNNQPIQIDINVKDAKV